MCILESSACFARASRPGPFWGPRLGPGRALRWSLLRPSPGPWWDPSLGPAGKA